MRGDDLTNMGMTMCIPKFLQQRVKGQDTATASAPPPPPAPVLRREQCKAEKSFYLKPRSDLSHLCQDSSPAGTLSPHLNYAKISLSCLPLITLQKAPSYYLNHVTDWVMCGLMPGPHSPDPPGCTAGMVCSPSTAILPTWRQRVFSEARAARVARVRR